MILSLFGFNKGFSFLLKEFFKLFWFYKNNFKFIIYLKKVSMYTKIIKIIYSSYNRKIKISIYYFFHFI